MLFYCLLEIAKGALLFDNFQIKIYLDIFELLKDGKSKFLKEFWLNNV